MNALKLKIDAVTPILQQLENAFQKREKEVVIELAIDRILHFIGVYLILILVILAKVSEVIAQNIMCFPANTTSVDISFMAYAVNYCWESKAIDSNFNSSTNKAPLLDDAKSVISFSRWIPYFFLAQVLLFSLPSLWWHTMVGARLTAHMQFILSYFKDMYESLSKIPAGVYRKLPYDPDGYFLDGWRSKRKDYKSKEIQGQNRDVSKTSEGSRTRSDQAECSQTKFNDLLKDKPSNLSEVVNAIVNPEIKELDDSDDTGGERENDERQKEDRLTGDLKDRHLFSMLCYENLASLDYYPYIMSVNGLTSTKAAEGDRKGIVPLKQGILRQFCHERNFSKNFLPKCYVIRYIISMLLSSILLLVCGITFGAIEYQTFETKAFTCDLPHHGKQMFCVLKGHWDVLALFLVNICILALYLITSIFQFYFVRFGSNRALCNFFEDMNDEFSVALGSAYEAEKREKNN